MISKVCGDFNSGALARETYDREFIVMKNAISASIPIESHRYTAAFAGMSPTGLDKAKLLATAEQYIAVVESEEKLFEEEYNTQYTEKVTSIEQQITERNAKLEELSKQMGILSQEVTTLKESSSQAAIQLRSKKDAFAQAAAVVKEEIKSEIQKINTYIN
jgi:chromosome segregation ATPase